MKQCQYCHEDLPDDSKFCIYCGKDLSENKEKKLKEEKYKKNNSRNYWGKIGALSFFFALIIIDFIVATVASEIGMNIKLMFMISSIIYLFAIICGILSFYKDYMDKKNGYEQIGNKNLALVSIFMSAYVLLINLTNVILK